MKQELLVDGFHADARLFKSFYGLDRRLLHAFLPTRWKRFLREAGEKRRDRRGRSVPVIISAGPRKLEVSGANGRTSTTASLLAGIRFPAVETGRRAE